MGVLQFIERYTDKKYSDFRDSILCFVEMYHREALKNFADEVRKIQLENCSMRSTPCLDEGAISQDTTVKI